MAIPKLKKQNIIDALKFIDENGVPEHNTSGKYGGYYTFECSKCGEFVTLYGVDGN